MPKLIRRCSDTSKQILYPGKIAEAWRRELDNLLVGKAVDACGPKIRRCGEAQRARNNR